MWKMIIYKPRAPEAMHMYAHLTKNKISINSANKQYLPTKALNLGGYGIIPYTRY